MNSSAPYIDPERAVADRYSRAARAPEAALCCPVDYDPELLEVIPREVIGSCC